METINTDVFQAIIDFETSKLYSLNEVNNNFVQGKIFYLDIDEKLTISLDFSIKE